METIYHTVYKTTNLTNNHIYIGCHVTTNKYDTYLGSGTNIKKAIKKFGSISFKKEILHECSNILDMLMTERFYVNEDFIQRDDTYNIILGGGGFNVFGCVTVKDKFGNTSMINKSDSRYLSGELVPIAKGTVNVSDSEGNRFQVDIKDSRYLSGELTICNKFMVPVKDKDGNNFVVHINDKKYTSGQLLHVLRGRVKVINNDGSQYSISVDNLTKEHKVFSKNKVVCEDKNGNRKQISLNDPRYLSGEFQPLIKGKLIVKDKEGKTYRLDKNDPRILSGELVHVNKGLTMKSEHKKLRSDKLKGIYVGEKSASYNKCFMHNLNDIQIRIDKSEVKKYLELGWIEGRKKTYKGATGLKNINNGQLTKKVSQEVLQTYLDQGWLLGALKYKKSK